MERFLVSVLGGRLEFRGFGSRRLGGRSRFGGQRFSEVGELVKLAAEIDGGLAFFLSNVFNTPRSRGSFFLSSGR